MPKQTVRRIDPPSHHNAQQILETIAAGTSANVGSDFFTALVKTLASTLGVRYAYACERLDQPVTKVVTLASWLGDRLGENFVYQVAATPCQRTTQGEKIFLSHGVQQQFPDDEFLVNLNIESYCGFPLHDETGQVIGHIALMDERPMETNLCEMPALRIFADRAAAELRRQHAERQLQQLRTQLTHVSRLSTMGEMAAGLAHELNQPLGAVAAYCGTCLELIRSGTAEQEDLLHALQKISNLTQRCGDIIQWLRRFARKDKPHFATLDLSKVIAEAATIIQREALQSHVRLELELTEAPLIAEADAIQIQQAILNLAVNGIDAMRQLDSADRILRLTSTQLPSGDVEIRVQNCGPEVHQETLRRMFEPFFTTKQEGLGLGLTICRSVAETHGGDLRAKALSEGGLALILRLPAPPASAIATKEITA